MEAQNSWSSGSSQRQSPSGRHAIEPLGELKEGEPLEVVGFPLGLEPAAAIILYLLGDFFALRKAASMLVAPVLNICVARKKIPSRF